MRESPSAMVSPGPRTGKLARDLSFEVLAMVFDGAGDVCGIVSSSGALVGTGSGINLSSPLTLVGTIGSATEGSGVDLTGDFGGSTTSGFGLTSDFSDAIEFCAVDLADLADDLGGGLIASVMLDGFEDLFAGSSEILAGDFWAGVILVSDFDDLDKARRIREGDDLKVLSRLTANKAG